MTLAQVLSATALMLTPVAAKAAFANTDSLATLPGVTFAFTYSSNASSKSVDGSVEDSMDVEDEIFIDNEPVDFVLVNGNVSLLDSATGHANAAIKADYSDAGNSRLLYQSQDWSLIENGAQHDTFESTWARFQTINTAASSLSICAMVVEWDESSWSEAGILEAAAEVEARLKHQCGANDTIALSFTAPVSTTVTEYLECEKPASNGLATLRLLALDSSKVEESSSTENRIFVRLTEGQCFKSVTRSEAETLQVSLSGGLSCLEASSSSTSRTGTESGSDSSSDWKHDLRFIVPMSGVVFLLGCGCLYYVMRQKKNATPVPVTTTPKEEEKEVIATLPYVLSMHSAV